MRILYVGQSHRLNDPRLLHREMKLLRSKIKDVEFWFLKYEKVSKACIAQNDEKPLIKVSHEIISGVPVNLMIVQGAQVSPFRIFGQLFSKVHSNIVNVIGDFFANSHIDFVQASDVREIRFAIQLGRKLESTLIYDSHEDYVRQAIDYGQNLKKYISAAIFAYVEARYLRQFDKIFCTDEFLLAKYSRRLYGAKSVTLLRNYPLISVGSERSIRTYHDVTTLRLVYIGGVNIHRGIIETAQYVSKFNENSEKKKLEFTVYSPDSEIVSNLVGTYDIRHIPWIDYSDLMAELRYYDVGICLWLPIRKFYRNLPLKNFDYMSQGLPIITSNFGNLSRYIVLSGGGICINPKSYMEFKSAIEPMFKGSFRRQLGESGLKWVLREGNFEHEGRRYVEFYDRPLFQD